ncbi:MAG: N-acetylmuramoyl-L-alanine amidase [Clostridia bacterium]|nr:N-acetylmuramoyl-L-alanine amidase [Clostridia bacterium]
MSKVFIGVGHGGSDPGAVANGFKEKDLNLAIATKCAEELRRHSVNVLMSRTKDENDTLDEEIAEANEFAPDLAVDFHNNAGGGDGAEAFYQHKSTESKELALSILEEVEKTGQNSRGAKIKLWGELDYFGFLREINCVAAIVEFAFIDNRKDMNIIDTKAEQEAMGIAAAKGILRKLGLDYIPISKEERTVNITLKELKKGSRGEQVKTVQRLLAYMGYSKSSIDGDFGANTDAGVRAYQKAMGLTVDGVVGGNTWNKLLRG